MPQSIVPPSVIENPPPATDDVTEHNDLPVVVYSPESPLRNPGKLIADIFRDMWRSRELIWILFMRDLKAQFRLSYFGYVWLFLPPVMTTAVWIFLNSQKVVSIPDSGLPYPVFVLVGTVYWQGFVRAIQSPIRSFTAGAPVFMKLKVSPEAFVAAGTLRALLDFSLYAVMLIPIMIAFKVTPAASAWLVMPLAAVAMLLLATCIGLLLTPLGGLYKDVEQILTVSFGFLMYLAPVVFPPPAGGWAATFMNWNPMTPILMAPRQAILGETNEYLWSMIGLMPFTAFLILAAFIILRVSMPHIVARLGM